MKQINDFQEFIEYMNRVGIRFHGAGCIPPTQRMWVDIETFLVERGFTYPYQVHWHRKHNLLEVHGVGAVPVAIDPFDGFREKYVRI